MRYMGQHEASLDDRRRPLPQDFHRATFDERGNGFVVIQRRVQHGADLGRGEVALGAAVEFDIETLRPTYRLHLGQFGMSNALKIARRLKLPRELLRKAHHYLRRKQRKAPEMVEPGLSLFSATRHLERIADHATNIAEDVVYLVEGVIIRHHPEAVATEE